MGRAPRTPGTPSVPPTVGRCPPSWRSASEQPPSRGTARPRSTSGSGRGSDLVGPRAAAPAALPTASSNSNNRRPRRRRRHAPALQRRQGRHAYRKPGSPGRLSGELSDERPHLGGEALDLLLLV